jgi:hypothetical protein
MQIQTLRALLVIDIAALLVVAGVHSGLIGGGPYQNAAMYETAVAVILAIGLALTFAGYAAARWGAIVAQVLALGGVGTGVYMASRGMAPNSTWDFAYHAFAIVLLLIGLVGAWRLRPPEQAAEASGLRRAG